MKSTELFQHFDHTELLLPDRRLRGRLMTRIQLLLALIIASIATGTTAQETGPQVAIAQTSITAKGIVRGGQVVFFSVGLDSDGYGPILRKTAVVVTDDDRDGEVTLAVNPRIPFRSAWIVIDTTNGQFAVVGPHGYRMRPAQGRRQVQRGASSGLLDEFINDIGSIDAIYFHPGKGVWVGQVTDGRESDGDHLQNGKTTLRLADMTPLVVFGEKPKEFGPGGVIATIDYNTMQVFASRVDSMIGGR
jgi:hypothetical protein